MRSSYEENHYGELIASITRIVNPNTIVEFGVLDGYSLSHLIEGSSTDCNIQAFDIFDDFPGHHARREKLEKKFGSVVQYGNYFTKVDDFDDYSIDLLHIDIANDGYIYQFAIDEYMQKLSENGKILLEGGSLERDNYPWMEKYNKPKIRPVLESTRYKWFTFSAFPSMTIISKK